MKLNLKSIDPSKLEKGKAYLCGEASLTGDITWTCREYDGKELRLIKNSLIVGDALTPIDEVFCFHDDYLIFELPLTIGN